MISSDKSVVTKLFSVILLLVLSLNLVAQDSVPSFEEETVYIAQSLELMPGMTVADVGAGDGEYTVFLSDQVGNSGKVYSTEVQPDLVESIKLNVKGKQNVTVLMGAHESTNLPEQCCDRILLRRVYHHFHHPGPMLNSLYTSLKPGGMIAVIDFLRAEHEVQRADATPDDHEHGVRPHHLIEEMEKVGFEMIRQVADWPSRISHGKATDFCMLFRKPV